MQNGGCHGLERGKNGELMFNKCRVSVWDDEDVQEVDSGENCIMM